MTNVWALRKADSLKLLLLRLAGRIDRKSYFLSDPDDDQDPGSVRIRKTDSVLVNAYVFVHGQDEGRYGVHLEYPRHEGSNLSDTVTVLENLTGKRAVEVLAVHFE